MPRRCCSSPGRGRVLVRGTDMLDRTCPRCGVPVQRTGTRGVVPTYCSPVCCQAMGRLRRGEIVPNAGNCEGCSASLVGRASNTRFCSHRCSTWSARHPGMTHPSATGRICRRCGVPIDGRDVRSSYCSGTCRDRRRAGVVVGEPRSCIACAKDFVATRNSHRYCSLSCSKNVAAKRRRALKRGVTVGRFDHAVVFVRDGWVCYLCGLQVDRDVRWPDPWSPSLDHVVPLAAGGAHSLENTRCTHLRCNMSKNDRILPVFADAVEAK